MDPTTAASVISGGGAVALCVTVLFILKQDRADHLAAAKDIADKLAALASRADLKDQTRELAGEIGGIQDEISAIQMVMARFVERLARIDDRTHRSVEGVIDNGRSRTRTPVRGAPVRGKTQTPFMDDGSKKGGDRDG